MSNPDPLIKQVNIPPLYPYVVGLSGAYGGPVPDVARRPDDIPKTPIADGSSISFFIDSVIAPISPPITSYNQGQWTGVQALDQDIWYNALTFSVSVDCKPYTDIGKIPGPFIRVTQGATYTITLTNNDNVIHSLYFQGAMRTSGSIQMAAPGQTSVQPYQFNHVGLFNYSSLGDQSSLGIVSDIARGLHGLILVEPAIPTDFITQARTATEFYIIENEFAVAPGGRCPETLQNYYVFDDRTYFPDASYQYLYQAGLINFYPGADCTTGAQLDNFTLPPKYFSFFNGRAGALVDHPLVASICNDVVIYYGKVGTHNSAPQLLGSIFDLELTGDLTTERKNISAGNVSASATAVYQIKNSSLTPTLPDALFGNAFIDSAGYTRHSAFGIMNVIVPEVQPRLVKTFRCGQITCCGPPERVINIVECNKKEGSKTVCPGPCSAPVTIEGLLSKRKNEASE